MGQRCKKQNRKGRPPRGVLSDRGSATRRGRERYGDLSPTATAWAMELIRGPIRIIRANWFAELNVIKKILKYGGIAMVCLIIGTLSSALLYRKYLQHEVSEARAIRSPNGIDSLEAVRIGGIDQWIEVRGQNVNNPILLFIHGGPGIAFISMGSTFQDPWEKYFTVVQWDQRGAGKTY
jgi:hypothetical protein